MSIHHIINDTISYSRVSKGQPVRLMGLEQPHGVVLVHGQGQVSQVAKDEHQLLTKTSSIFLSTGILSLLFQTASTDFFFDPRAISLKLCSTSNLKSPFSSPCVEEGHLPQQSAPWEPPNWDHSWRQLSQNLLKNPEIFRYWWWSALHIDIFSYLLLQGSLEIRTSLLLRA